MQRRIVTKEEQLTVIELARQGLVRREIGERTGLSRDIIENICRKFCVRLALARRGYPRDEIRIRAIATLAQHTPVMAQLARQLGCSPETIRRNLEQARTIATTNPDK